MAGTEPTDGTLIDLPRDDIKDTERQVDASEYSLAAVFGSVALPPDMPEYLKAKIEDRADADRRAAQASGFVIADNADLVDGKTRREREQDDDDNIQSYVSNALQHEEERQREEWSRTRSTVGGVTMTGAEWADLAERLRNDKDLKETILAKFRNRGMSDEEANERYDRVTEIAGIAAKPPSQRTEIETEKFERANADPSFAGDMALAKSVVQSNGVNGPATDMGKHPIASVPALDASNSTETPKAIAPVAAARLDF